MKRYEVSIGRNSQGYAFARILPWPTGAYVKYEDVAPLEDTIKNLRNDLRKQIQKTKRALKKIEDQDGIIETLNNIAFSLTGDIPGHRD